MSAILEHAFDKYQYAIAHLLVDPCFTDSCALTCNDLANGFSLTPITC